MSKDGGGWSVTVMAFGQLAERLGGRTHHHMVPAGSTVRTVVEDLALHEWIDFGLSVALNGNRCSLDTPIHDGAEVALLPPVSGG